VGDPHITVQRIDDGRAFLKRLAALSRNKDIKQVIILGDLFHTFAVIRSEVLEAWCNFFSEVKVPIIALVGNHDYAGQSGGSHALEPLRYIGEDHRVIVDKHMILNGVHYLPFMRNNDEFEKHCQNIPAHSVLVCHQSFQGAEFGSGYLDPHGVDTRSIRHLNAVVSGHIHKRQAFGNVWYPGTPFQHNFADAGYNTHVFTVDLTSTGYHLIEEHDLGMPRYEIITGGIGSIADDLPKPNPTTSYKIVSKGTPSEISAFWKDQRVRDFRKKSRRVVDGLVPERGEVPHELFRERGDKREKLESFIKSRNWRCSTDIVLAAAGAIFTK
jgi:DNA repair exonuclease SbcCD nuclease subunit